MNGLAYIVGKATVFTDTDWGAIALIVTIAIAAAAALTMITTLLASLNRDDKWLAKMKDVTNSVKVYRFDQYHDEVMSFSLSDIGEREVCTFREFYESLPTYERQKVRNWVDSIFDNQGSFGFMPLDLTVGQDRKRKTPSFMSLTKNNTEQNVIHMTNYLLHFGAPLERSMKSFSTADAFAKELERHGSESGYSMCFTLSARKDTFELDDEACLKFASGALRCISGDELAITISKTELIIVNFDMVEPSEAVAFAMKVANAALDNIGKAKNRRKAYYSIRCGIVAHKDFQGNSGLILLQARKEGDKALANGESIRIYDQSESSVAVADESHYHNEIDRVINQKLLKLYFRPVFNARQGQTTGYMCKCVPTNTTFGSFQELQNYALRSNDQVSLLTAVLRNAISRFVNERGEESQEMKMYFPMRVAESPIFFDVTRNWKNIKKANLVLLFEENDILQNINQYSIDEFKDFIDKIHDKGYGFAIRMRDKTLDLDESIYSKADIFFVDFTEDAGDDINTKIRSELHALVEKLLKYKVTIIATNLLTWNGVELVVGSGIVDVSVDPLAKFDQMILPVAEKKKAKIVDMANR